jgi:energy-coupling factor transport system ATP-binding protein
LPIADRFWTLNHGVLETVDPAKLENQVKEAVVK